MYRKIIIVILLAILALTAFVYYYREKKEESDHLLLFGNVDIRQVDIAFRVGGRVEQLFFEEGDIVTEGQLMATIETQPYQDYVKEAEAQIESIKVSLVNAERLLLRRLDLIGDGGVSQEDLDNTATSKENLEANLRQATANLGVARKNLADTKVYAPTKGTILTRIREPGSVVREGDPVYTLSISSPVWIRAFVSEPNLGLIYPGMKAEVFTDTPGAKIFQGTIGFISPIAEFTPKSVQTTELRTDLVYRIRVYIDNPDWGLKQGMPVTVKLKLPKSEEIK